MNLALMQHSINWFRQDGGHFDVELFVKAAKAIEKRPPQRRNRVLSVRTVNYNK